MMEFSGSRDQRRAVQRALQKLNKAGFSDQRIADAIASDVADGKVEGIKKSSSAPVSRPTIHRIRNADDDSLLNVRGPQMSAVYGFLRQSKEMPTELYAASKVIRSSHRHTPLLDAFDRTMRAQDGPLTNEKLRSLAGDFYLYRKAWTSPYADSYVRCVLRFEWVGEALFYTEVQKFFDSVEDLPVDEADEGVVIPFGMNVVLLGRGAQKDLLKFFSFHDFTPYPDGHQHVHRMAGNFIAVYAKGPHPGFGAFARRVQGHEGEATCAFYRPDELDDDIINRIEHSTVT